MNTAGRAVAAGATYTAAAQAAGHHSGDAVGRLVARFNQQGLEALAPRHGGGQPARYTSAERERILSEARGAPDGLPQVTAFTIWCVLHDASWRWQRSRSWCETGTAVRLRKRGRVVVHDPDAEAKKGDRASLPRGGGGRGGRRL
jgi:hypothetical protein